MLLTVHQNTQWGIKPNMANISGFFDSWHGIQNILPEQATATHLINRKIAHTKTGEVLEEVRALTWVDTVVV